MNQKITDELLDEMIAEAGKKAIEKMSEEDLKRLDNAYPYEISKEHEEKMKKIIKNAGWVNTSKNEKKRYSFSNKFLVAAVIATLIFALAIGGVGAWRDNLVNYFLNVKEEYSDVKKNDKSQACEVENIYFGYMPTGYELENRKDNDNAKILFFEKENGPYISLEIQNRNSTQEINTENGEIEEIVVNGKDMVCTQREGLVILTWHEGGKTYSLYTNTSKELIIKVAENISFLNK